jgi:hypothetical protein
MADNGGGTGRRLACDSGSHEGGDDRCVSIYACSAGSHNDGTGTCRPTQPTVAQTEDSSAQEATSVTPAPRAQRGN